MILFLIPSFILPKFCEILFVTEFGFYYDLTALSFKPFIAIIVGPGLKSRLEFFFS